MNLLYVVLTECCQVQKQMSEQSKEISSLLIQNELIE
jgi:hypothetical protein